VEPRQLLLAVPVIFAMLGTSAGVATELCRTLEVPPDLAKEITLALKNDKWLQFVDVLRRLEYTGLPGVLYLLSGAYEGGYGEFLTEEARQERARRLMTRAALCGHPHAVEVLAAAYESGGLGIKPDQKTAKCLWDASLQYFPIAECGITLEAVKE
jgi:hypothetical protein